MFKRINKEVAQAMLDDPDTILLDIRDSESFEEGHLEKSINLTQNEIASFIDSTPRSKTILVICYHGNSSQSVAQYLDLNGFADVSSIDGGYEGWINS